MEISQRLFDVHELRDGKVVRTREYLAASRLSRLPGWRPDDA